MYCRYECVCSRTTTTELKQWQTHKTQTTKIQNTYNTEKLIKHFLDDARRHNEDMFIVYYYI